ncbi:hypothetical protein Plhal304r1_c009g0036871 [Plasmopara halstedii]
MRSCPRISNRKKLQSMRKTEASQMTRSSYSSVGRVRVERSMALSFTASKTTSFAALPVQYRFLRKSVWDSDM